MPPSTSPGLSRRALFGLGLSRVGERLHDVPAPRPARPDATAAVAAVRAGWQTAWAAERGRPTWSAVEEELVAMAGVDAHERVVAFDGDLAAPPQEDEEPADVLVSPFGLQSTPTGFAALAGMFARVRPGGRVAFSAWSSGAVLRLLRDAGRVDPLPAGLPPASTWGRDERLRQDLDRHADEGAIAYTERTLTLAQASPEAMLATLVAAVPALAVAVERHGDPAREAFAGVLAPYLRPEPAGGVRVDVPYLAVVARKR